MKALVLGGGSLKGAWQAGAIQAVIESGFHPEMIYGISAGALNASFLVNQAGLQMSSEGQIDWELVNKNLLKFWLENINKPDDIGLMKSKIALGIDTLMSRFDGFIDTNPLHEKLKKYLDIETLRQSPIQLKVGAVNINSGEMKYVSPETEHFLDYLRASSSLPFIMPAIQIGGKHKEAYMDGGLREVVPLRKAIEDGATEIYCIATHTQSGHLENFNYRNFLSLIERIKDITVNQFENNDLDWAENHLKTLVNIGPFSLNKKFKLEIIRPAEPIKIELTNFSEKDVRRVIKQGYEAAHEHIHKHK